MLSTIQSIQRRLLLLLGAGSVASGLWGCPGSLRDPAAFENFIESETADAESNPSFDAGAPSETGPVVIEPGSDAASSPPGDGGCWEEVQDTIFTPSCAVVGCHNASSATFGLVLASPINLAALLNQPTVEADGGFLLIDTAHPLESALYTKLGATPPFGLQMPYGMPPLSSAQIQCVADWITAQVNASNVAPAVGTAADASAK